MISLLIAGAARSKRPWRGPATALLLYAVYAVLVRRYFLLIIVAAAGVWMFRRSSIRWRAVGVLACLLGLFLLPDAARVALLHPRDMAVDYLVYQSPFGARTSFYNLLPPDSFPAFCIDYAYAIARLNLALFFSPGAKELALQLFVFVAIWPALRMRGRSRHSSGGKDALARETFSCLILGHVCVSMLFEPDLGSYIRHLSSVALFSMLLLADWCEDNASARRVLSAQHADVVRR
jgi:hypothetical protein